MVGSVEICKLKPCEALSSQAKFGLLSTERLLIGSINTLCVLSRCHSWGVPCWSSLIGSPFYYAHTYSALG